MMSFDPAIFQAALLEVAEATKAAAAAAQAAQAQTASVAQATTAHPSPTSSPIQVQLEAVLIGPSLSTNLLYWMGKRWKIFTVLVRLCFRRIHLFDVQYILVQGGCIMLCVAFSKKSPPPLTYMLPFLALMYFSCTFVHSFHNDFHRCKFFQATSFDPWTSSGCFRYFIFYFIRFFDTKFLVTTTYSGFALASNSGYIPMGFWRFGNSAIAQLCFFDSLQFSLIIFSALPFIPNSAAGLLCVWDTLQLQVWSVDPFDCLAGTLYPHCYISSDVFLCRVDDSATID